VNRIDLEAHEKVDPQTRVDGSARPTGPGRLSEPAAKPTVPRWRSSSAGLIILHVLLGLVVLGTLQGVVIVLLVSILGRDPTLFLETAPLERVLATFTGLIGWLLFVYLRRSTVVRTLWFMALLLAGLGTAVASALSIAPVLRSGDFDPPVLRADDFEGSYGYFFQETGRGVDLSYTGGEYRVRVVDAYYPRIMRTFLDDAQPAVRVEATLRFPVGTHQHTIAGVGCWGGPGAYQLVLAPGGEAVLLEVVSENTGERRLLTEDVQTEATPLRGPVPLRLDCVGGGRGETAVVGWVGNEQVGAVGIPGGLDNWNGPGFVVYAAENGTEVRFDDFSARTDTGEPGELAPPIDLSGFEGG
jgi:hypothetical protein